ncbi:hypothetical protein ABZP36_034201 [Zizania latifolia]
MYILSDAAAEDEDEDEDEDTRAEFLENILDLIEGHKDSMAREFGPKNRISDKILCALQVSSELEQGDVLDTHVAFASDDWKFSSVMELSKEQMLKWLVVQIKK